MWTKKGHRTGQKKPFKLEDIWRIRTRLEIEGNIMELALLNLAIDCKLRSCDLLRMKVRDISSGGIIQNRVLFCWRTWRRSSPPSGFRVSAKRGFCRINDVCHAANGDLYPSEPKRLFCPCFSKARTVSFTDGRYGTYWLVIWHWEKQQKKKLPLLKAQFG